MNYSQQNVLEIKHDVEEVLELILTQYQSYLIWICILFCLLLFISLLMLKQHPPKCKHPFRTF